MRDPLTCPSQAALDHSPPNTIRQSEVLRVDFERVAIFGAPIGVVIVGSPIPRVNVQPWVPALVCAPCKQPNKLVQTKSRPSHYSSPSLNPRRKFRDEVNH